MKNNRGFTLVELIIVMAIIAILAAVIAPNLMQYINKSKKTKDIAMAENIARVVQLAISDKEKFDYSNDMKIDIIKNTDGSLSLGRNTGVNISIDSTGRTLKLQPNVLNISDNSTAISVCDIINNSLNLGQKNSKITIYNGGRFVFGISDGNIVVLSSKNREIYQIFPERTGEYSK